MKLLEGFKAQDGDVELIHLNNLNIRSGIACENGWGKCRDGDCILVDDFQGIREKIGEADALVFVTPVYFGDLSESARRFLDRLRRTEAFSGRGTCHGKPFIGVAAAVGSGNGAVRVLGNLEYYFKRLGCMIVDLVPVTKFSGEHKYSMLLEAGKRLAKRVPDVAPS